MHTNPAKAIRARTCGNAGYVENRHRARGIRQKTVSGAHGGPGVRRERIAHLRVTVNDGKTSAASGVSPRGGTVDA